MVDQDCIHALLKLPKGNFIVLYTTTPIPTPETLTKRKKKNLTY